MHLNVGATHHKNEEEEEEAMLKPSPLDGALTYHY